MNDATRKANARAAAPDLLAALQGIVKDYEALCGDGMTEASQPPQLRAARAAIALATSAPAPATERDET